MMSFTCPHCAETLEFTELQGITTHVRKCGKTSKAKAAKVVDHTRVLPSMPREYRLQKELDSQNAHHTRHWRSYSKSVNEWKAIIDYTLSDLKGLNLSWSEWEICRLYCKPKRAYDFANLVGGAKPVPDSLKASGIIVDDKPANFKCDYFQVEASAPLTIIRLIAANL
jgi:hypothetical protein